MSDKDFNERDAFSNCFSSAQLLSCLYHTLRSLRRKITCEKVGVTSAELGHCLEIFQSMAFSKQEEEYSKNLIQLKNTKIKSVVDYREENWFKFKGK